jgi:hypothetical protein
MQLDKCISFVVLTHNHIKVSQLTSHLKHTWSLWRSWGPYYKTTSDFHDIKYWVHYIICETWHKNFDLDTFKNFDSELYWNWCGKKNTQNFCTKYNGALLVSRKSGAFLIPSDSIRADKQCCKVEVTQYTHVHNQL